MQASAMSFFGSRVTNAASCPHCASETATLASPPPKVISSCFVWLNRRWPGVASRSMTSPKVTIRMDAKSLESIRLEPCSRRLQDMRKGPRLPAAQVVGQRTLGSV